MKKLKAVGFWLLSFTWGLPVTLYGVLCAIALLLTGHKPKRFHWYIYFEVGKEWGGFNAGCFFVVSKDNDLYMRQHESGHGLQNIIFGVLMPFVVCIPSVIRYWYREYLVGVKKRDYWSLPPYDSIWFEGWATRLGQKYFK